MKHRDIKTAALAEGFSAAEIMQTDRIVFDPVFRPYCKENRCGQYGINYSCPPACGSPEQMKERVLAYQHALVLQTACEISDLSQTDRFREAKRVHNAAMLRLVKVMRENGHDGFMIGASGCSLCSPCALPSGEPCRFPNLMYSCVSAYCIHAKQLAESCSMSYDYQNGILPFFGLYIFN